MGIMDNIKKKLVETGDIPIEEIMEDIEIDNCPICEGELNESICKGCKTDFNEIFSCPFLSEENLPEKICNVDNKPCPLKGLEYETCDKYHNNLTGD